LSLAVPVSEENAFKDRRRLMRGGRRLLVSAGLIALAFFFAIIVIASYGSSRDQNLALIIGDYVVTLGIAVPGLTLYLLRLYTDRSIRKGNPKAFTRRAKLAFVSISWVVLVIIVALLITQRGAWIEQVATLPWPAGTSQDGRRRGVEDRPRVFREFGTWADRASDRFKDVDGRELRGDEWLRLDCSDRHDAALGSK
jgi:hypothetical protein